ncbi:LacI family DNA-binding transcriptional regulator [Meridianimarinicoccus sp. RP-17]|uniref:LacI family DNA-binding transcriptional regulator n=1 Tax=Meridianimarinicoccus zhengii TaxID=2056810 RepID=UPI000DAE535A|nr:LacI family DNA-binding transcriptional regulator [Phycocomes zhengii]
MNDATGNLPADMSRTRAPTLADVARIAGVSTATVSRCLNDPARVVGPTRDRVMAAVEALGYAPNFSARALAVRSTSTLGVVIPTMDNAIFARGVQAFQEELGRNGKTLLIASSGYREDLEAAQIRTLVARGADALLLIGLHRGPEIHEFLRRRGVPTVAAWCYAPDAPLPCIGFDNVAAMAELARRVLHNGHRRIGMISAPTAANDRARGRVAGVRLAMKEAGLPDDTLTLVETEYGLDTGRAALHDILARAPQTTAVLCGNDVLAVGALRGAREAGLRVPDDISITGFDDIDIATLAEPGLTTVHVPHREMGRRAAQALVAAIESGTPPASVRLATDIRERGSLGAAAAVAGSPRG